MGYYNVISSRIARFLLMQGLGKMDNIKILIFGLNEYTVPFKSPTHRIFTLSGYIL